MCLARPVRVTSLEGDWVEVEDDKGLHRAWSALLLNKGVSVGDYLLVHGELAINTLPEDEALRIIEIIEELGEHAH